jgi:hypothetical protein
MNARGQKWTHQHLQMLKLFNEGKNINEVAQSLSRTPLAITYALDRIVTKSLTFINGESVEIIALALQCPIEIIEPIVVAAREHAKGGPSIHAKYRAEAYAEMSALLQSGGTINEIAKKYNKKVVSIKPIFSRLINNDIKAGLTHEQILDKYVDKEFVSDVLETKGCVVKKKSDTATAIDTNTPPPVIINLNKMTQKQKNAANGARLELMEKRINAIYKCTSRLEKLMIIMNDKINSTHV